MPKLYVTDTLLFEGREHRRGDLVNVSDEQAELLLEEGRLSENEPEPLPPAAPDDPQTVPELQALVASLRAELAEARGGEPSEGGSYDGQSKDDLQAEADRRELDVQGTGSNGNVTKADLVKALEADDEEPAS